MSVLAVVAVGIAAWAFGSVENSIRPKGSSFHSERVHGCGRSIQVSVSGSKMLTLYRPLLLCMSWPPKTYTRPSASVTRALQ